MRKNKGRIIGYCTALTAAFIGIACGCKTDEEQAKMYELPTETALEMGVEYTPNFAVEEGIEVKALRLKTPTVSKTILNGTSFTPDAVGKYEYTVLFTDGKEYNRTETVVFTAADTLAPVITTPIADKEAGLGFYTSVQNDLNTLVAADNCANTLIVRAAELNFNQTSTSISSNDDVLYFEQAGEYTVRFTVSDFYGNQTNGSYKINVTDTVAPVIDAPKMLFVWAEGEKTKIPAVNVIDMATTTYEVSAKDSEGQSVAVENGYLMTKVAGRYELTFTARDASNNLSQPFTMHLVVNEKPIINDFEEEGSGEQWNEVARTEEGKLRVQSHENTITLFMGDYFSTNDWSGYNRFAMTIQNERGNDLTVRFQILVDGKWVNAASDFISAASFTVDSVTPTAKNCGFYLDDYGIEKAQNVRVVLECEGGVEVSVDTMRLENAGKPASPSTDSLTGAFNGAYALKGGETIVRGGEEISFGSHNAVSYTIWASADCNVVIGLKIGNETISCNASLTAGANELFRLPLKEGGADILSKNITALSLYNGEDYAVTLYISDFATCERNETAIEELIAGGDYGVVYGDEFTVPNPFKLDGRYYSNLSVSLKKGDTVVLENLQNGQSVSTVGENALESGEYTLVYSFEDAFGVEREYALVVCVQKNILSLGVEDSVYYTGAREMSAPILTSDVFSEAQLANATVEKYYRKAGGKAWIQITDELCLTKEGNYEFRYVATVEGVRREEIFSKFVHKNTMIMDFEPESAAGDNRVVADQIVNEKDELEWTVSYEPSRFLLDGGHYDYRANFPYNRMQVSSDWSKSGSYSLYSLNNFRGWNGTLISPISVGEKPVTSVSFWLKADASFTTEFEVGLGYMNSANKTAGPKGGWVSTGEVDVLAGEHYYTLYFERPVTEDICALSFRVSQGVGTYFDDIEFKTGVRLIVGDVEYDNAFELGVPYTLTPPSISSTAYTEAEYRQGSWALTYSYSGEKEKALSPVDGVWSVAFDRAGEYTFTWSYTYLGHTVSTSTTMLAGKFEIEADMPRYIQGLQEIVIENVRAELDMSAYQVFYRLQGSADWTELTENVGKHAFTPQTDGTYEVKIVGNAAYNEKAIEGELIKKVIVEDESVVWSFEDGERYPEGSKQYNDWSGKLLSVAETDLGSYALAVKGYGTWSNCWVGWSYTNADKAQLYEDSKPSNKLLIKLRADVELTDVKFYTSGSGGYAAPIPSVGTEWQVYILEFESNLTSISSFEINARWQDIYHLYIDYIATVDEAEIEWNVPAKVEYGASALIPTPTFDRECTNITVSYQKAGEETWTALALGTNGYEFTPENIGKYNVKIEYSYFYKGIQFTAQKGCEIEVDVDLTVNFTLPTEAVLGSTVSMEAPAFDKECTNVALSYKKYSDESWTTLSAPYAFTADSIGGYQVRVEYTYAGLNLEKLYTVACVPANTFWAFEDGNHLPNGASVETASGAWQTYYDRGMMSVVDTDEGTKALSLQKDGKKFWVGFYQGSNAVPTGVTSNKIVMRVKADADVVIPSNRFYFYGNVNYATATNISLTTEWQEITLTFDKDITSITGFTFALGGLQENAVSGSATQIYFDYFALG